MPPLSPKEVDLNKLYTVNETARLLDVSEQTIRKHLREKRLTGRKIGRRWLIRGSMIRKFMEG